MVGAGYCSRGQLQIKRVVAKAKIHAVYFQEEVMRPIYLQDIPRLNGRYARYVQIHMDKASSHTAKLSQRFYRQMRDETGIKVIPISLIPVKSPDASPMDFCDFYLVKRGLSSRRPRTIEGLWKVCRHTWQDISTALLRRRLLK
ncbi:hypothetical protein C0J52_10375 [Blattella germanica]|nr:hypothetical protein C0J52_10375 [Blattella germanica]